MSVDPATMQAYMQMLQQGQQRQAPNNAVGNAMTPMLRALLLAKMRQQQQQQLQPINSLQSQMISPFAGGTGSNAAPGGGDPSLEAAEAADVS
jgi:hypothetical protein